MSVPIVHQNPLFDLENIMVGNGITVNAGAKLSLTQRIPLCAIHEKAMNGLHLLIVCSTDIPEKIG